MTFVHITHANSKGLFIVFFLFSHIGISFAQYGMPDSSFGADGKVTTGVNGFDNYAYSMAVQPDGKILVGGTISSTGISSTSQIAITRYNTDGTLDNTFGNVGMSTTDFPTAANFGCGINIQYDGKILLSGFSQDLLTLIRYDSDGKKDSSFGVYGNAVFNIDNDASEVPAKVCELPDGNIITGATGSVGIGGGWSFIMVRCTPDGSLDNIFGDGGIVSTKNNGNNWYCNDIAVQCDGTIVAIGCASNAGGGMFRLAVLKYTASGALDNSFGTGGMVFTGFPGVEGSYGTHVAIKSDGRIVVTGYLVEQGSFKCFLAQYLQDGTLDPSFGSGGMLETNFPSGNGIPNSLLVQPDGKIIMGGQSGIYEYYYFAMARFNANGSPDSSFGTNGQMETTFGSSSVGTALAMQEDGKILQAGYAWDSSNAISGFFNVAVARFASGLTSAPPVNCPLDSMSNAPFVRVFPNPFTDNINVTLDLPTSENINIEVYDIIGRLIKVYYLNQIMQGGSYYLSLNEDDAWASGEYILRVKAGQQTFNIKLIKISP